MRQTVLPVLLAISLSACATSGQQTAAPPPPPRDVSPQVIPPTAPVASSAGFIAPQILEGPGLGGIIRESMATVTARFGTARLDTREGDMRKLQYRGEPCVLDVYFYPLAPGAEPVATWVEARRSSDGEAVDRYACIQALSVGG